MLSEYTPRCLDGEYAVCDRATPGDGGGCIELVPRAPDGVPEGLSFDMLV
jgi:hypothetical protein